MTSQGASPGREQINITVDAAVARALRVIAVRDGKSVPDLLRPSVERFVRARLKRDADLAASVNKLEASIVAEGEKRRRRGGGASISELRRERTAKPHNKGGGRPGVGSA